MKRNHVKEPASRSRGGSGRRFQRLRWPGRGNQPGASIGGAIARRRWSRFMPVVFAVIAIMATLAAILLLNVMISDGQYRLVQLRAEERSLAQEAEALNQDLEFYQAPQNLAISASDQGMVPATSEGVVDLEAQEVRGTPEPAGDSEEKDVLLSQPVQRGSAAADRAAAAARERRDALPDSQEQANAQLRAANEAEKGVDLRGGSIPGPQQRPPADATPMPSPTEVPTGNPASAGAAPQPGDEQQAPDDQPGQPEQAGQPQGAVDDAPAGGSQ